MGGGGGGHSLKAENKLRRTFHSECVKEHTTTQITRQVSMTVHSPSVRYISRFLGSCAVKMEAAQSSETTASNHHTTRRNNPENHELYIRR
jgi:hypothetical protein